MSSNKEHLLMVGCGAMGSALLQPWLDENFFASVTVVSPHQPPFPGVKWLTPEKVNIGDFGGQSPLPTLLCFSIKPQLFQHVITCYAPFVAAGALPISIAAGVETASIAALLGNSSTPVVRAMPNLAARVKKSATTLWATPGVPEARKKVCERLFALNGSTTWLDNEQQFHAVTALAGSGPAFLCAVWEAMLSASTLPPAMTAELTAQLWRGTLAWIEDKGGAPDAAMLSALREAVTSTGGTTAAGLEALQPVLPGLLKDVLDAAALRSQRLADGYKKS